MRKLSFSLALLISFFSLVTQAQAPASMGDKLAREGWDLRHRIEAFYRVEPYLHPNPMFGSIQNWTLENQNYYPRHGQIFRQIVVTHPQYVSMDLVKRAYEKYLLKLNTLTEELPDQVDLHMGLITEDKFRNEILTDIKTALAGIGNRQLREWILVCDYLAQPILTIWYLGVALDHLEKIGRFKMGPEWDKYTNSLMKAKGLKPVAEVRKDILNYIVTL